jgi:hypothetical protein
LDDYGIRFRRRLRAAGFSGTAIDAVWPAWWSDAAEASPSAIAELRFSVARKLGLDPRALSGEQDAPTFVWTDAGRFKHLRAETLFERAALASFGMSVGRVLVDATESSLSIQGAPAKSLRASILGRTQPFVRLVDLLGLCWSVGIPIVHLRVFPLEAKRMAAMSVRVGDRYAILLGKDATYPAWIAFHIAHELGHIAAGHLRGDTVLVDMEAEGEAKAEDGEEDASDGFALELLTGSAEPRVVTTAVHPGARQLAQRALQESSGFRIEPGVLALCYGHSTGNWPTANKALKFIYDSERPVWAEVNKVARAQLDPTRVSEDTAGFLEAILGAT